MNEGDLIRFFRRHGIDAEVHHYGAMGRNIYFARVGSDGLPALLFVHGAPASMKIYRKFFQDKALPGRFCIYAVDRPGYGVTGGEPEPSIERQAAMIAPLARQIRDLHGVLVLVGGSYGAPVVCRLLMEQEGIADGLVLVVPSLGPGLEKMYRIAPLLAKGPLSKLVSQGYRSASVEKISHQEELEKMLPLWSRIRVPVVYMQSEGDRVVYTANADFARKRMTEAPVLTIRFFPGRKHDIDYRYEHEIAQEMLKFSGSFLNRKPTISED